MALYANCFMFVKGASDCFKAPANKETLFAETVMRKHCFLAAQTGKYLLKNQNVSEKSQKHFFCFSEAKNVSATNVSSFAAAFTVRHAIFTHSLTHSLTHSVYHKRLE